MRILSIFSLGIVLLVSCQKAGYGDSSADLASGGGSGIRTSVSGPGGGNGDTTIPAGKVTAGEWNDFSNWPFWQNLMTNDTFKVNQSKWGFTCVEKWEFVVKDANEKPVADAMVTVAANGATLWQGKTNKLGTLNMLPGVFSTGVPASMQYTVSYASQVYNSGNLSTTVRTVNTRLPIAAANSNSNAVDVMFVVDATGSMGDEISFLKNELLDVLNRSESMLPGALRYAGVFYRDLGDAYVTRSSSFSSDKNALVNFVKAQEAGGGGDTPEAVEEALKTAMQQNWSDAAKARLLFLILDAPPHEESAKMQVVRQQVQQAAAKGIMIIPITASGIDKPTEFLMRFIAQATNSTYVFITNHSGIGNNHIAATVGAYQVEFLNNLMVRLIGKYGGN